MTTSAGAFTDLLALQQLDTALDQVRHHRANLPERRALASANAMRSAIERGVAELDVRHQAIEAAEAKLERSLRELDARSADLATKLQRTMVVREAEALMAEQRTTRTRRSEVEDEELALLEEDEGLDSARSSRQAELADADREIAGAAAALTQAEAELAGQESDLAGRRQGVASALAADLLARYEELRPRFDGVAVAQLDGGRCSGCHLTLSTAALERIRLAPADAWVECEECGRLLVR